MNILCIFLFLFFIIISIFIKKFSIKILRILKRFFKLVLLLLLLLLIIISFLCIKEAVYPVFTFLYLCMFNNNI